MYSITLQKNQIKYKKNNNSNYHKNVLKNYILIWCIRKDRNKLINWGLIILEITKIFDRRVEIGLCSFSFI